MHVCVHAKHFNEYESKIAHTSRLLQVANSMNPVVCVLYVLNVWKPQLTTHKGTQTYTHTHTQNGANINLKLIKYVKQTEIRIRMSSRICLLW